MLLSTLFIVLYIFISGDLYAGSVYIKIALGWNTYVSIIGARLEFSTYSLIKNCATGTLKVESYNLNVLANN